MENTKRGGKRPGAGRKRGFTSIKAEEARKYMVDEIAKEIGPIVRAQMELAKGIYYEDENRVVYQKLPDSKTGMYLLNQIAGRATETVHVKNELDFAQSLRQLALDALERKKERKLLEEPKIKTEVKISEENKDIIDKSNTFLDVRGKNRSDPRTTLRGYTGEIEVYSAE